MYVMVVYIVNLQTILIICNGNSSQLEVVDISEFASTNGASVGQNNILFSVYAGHSCSQMFSHQFNSFTAKFTSISYQVIFQSMSFIHETGIPG